MKLKLIKSCSISMLDNPENFTGWDNNQKEQNSNIFKLLRDNLNSYQHQYSLQHAKEQPIFKRQSYIKKNKQNKQNHIKLPTIQTTPLKRQGLTKKTSLQKTIDHLQSMMSYEVIKKEPSASLFQQIQATNFRQFREIKSREIKKSNDNTMDKIFLKKNKFFSISKALKYKNVRQKRSDNLMQYEFSDEKIIKYKHSFMNEVRCFSNLEMQ